MKTLSVAQTRAFISAVAGDRSKALYVLAVSTGMRQGELLAAPVIAITLDVYSHVTPTMHREAAEVLEAVLGGEA